MTDDLRLIEDYIPIEEISKEARREKSIRKGHISTLHLWWARRPLVAARAAVYGALVPAPKGKKAAGEKAKFVADLCAYPGAPADIKQAQRHILEAHAARLTAERGELVTIEDIEAGRASRPRVLDMFAGGGAIPLEALRLGCEAYAVDLNPVAHIIELCTLVYPQQYGAPDPGAVGCAPDGTWAGLAAEVEHWGKWVLERAKAEIGDLYPPIPNPRPPKRQDTSQIIMDLPAPQKLETQLKKEGMLVPVAYVWTRTVTCKNPLCGGEVPLARQTWLRSKEGEFVALRPDVGSKTLEVNDRKRVAFKLVKSKSKDGLGFDPSEGSTSGNVSCLFCGTVVDAGYVKQVGNSSGLGVQLLAIVANAPNSQVKIYLDTSQFPSSSLPDDESIWNRIRELEDLSKSDPAGPLSIPREPIINDAKGSAWVVQYGIRNFDALFTPRQLLSLLTFTKYIRRTHQEALKQGYRANHALALTTLLAAVLDKLVDFSSTLATLKATGGRGVVHSFVRQALPLVWDFAETNPFNPRSASWQSSLQEVVDNLRKLKFSGQPSNVIRGSAVTLPYEDNKFDAAITDPPYYDNVPYANISDFFFVWLKRSVGFLYPEHFSTMLTPKKQEAVADASRHGDDRRAAGRAYELMIFQAFVQVKRVLKPRAPLVVVYAHKTTWGWATLVDALRRAGFVVTEAWPLDTEMAARLRAKDSAALASSIFLVARRREGDAIGSYEDDVQPELQSIVRERVDSLWARGVTGADLVLACVGAGMRAFTRYARVEYANGQEVPAEGFLAEVEGTVLEVLLEKIFGVGQAGISGVDPVTRFYVLWRYTYRAAAIGAGEAIIFTYPQHVELDELARGGAPLVEKRGSAYRLLDFTQRGADEALGLPGAGRDAPLIDVLHRLLYLVENFPAGIPAFLEEASPDYERLRIVAQTLAGQTLAGNGSGGGKSLVAARGAEAAALRKLTTNWRNLIENHRHSLV